MRAGGQTATGSCGQDKSHGGRSRAEPGWPEQSCSQVSLRTGARRTCWDHGIISTGTALPQVPAAAQPLAWAPLRLLGQTFEQHLQLINYGLS